MCQNRKRKTRNENTEDTANKSDRRLLSEELKCQSHCFGPNGQSCCSVQDMDILLYNNRQIRIMTFFVIVSSDWQLYKENRAVQWALHKVHFRHQRFTQSDSEQFGQQMTFCYCCVGKLNRKQAGWGSREWGAWCFMGEKETFSVCDTCDTLSVKSNTFVHIWAWRATVEAFQWGSDSRLVTCYHQRLPHCLTSTTWIQDTNMWKDKCHCFISSTSPELHCKCSSTHIFIRQSPE